MNNLSKTFFASLISTCVVISCTTDKGLWKSTQEVSTAGAYENYLEKKPEGKFSRQARTILDSLYESDAFDKAAKSNTIFSYEEFLNEHPDGVFSDKANELIRTIEAYHLADSVCSIDSFEEFVALFPTGGFADQVQLKLDSLKVVRQDEYNRAIEINNAEQYENFLRKYPRSEYASQISKQLRQVATSDELEYLQQALSAHRDGETVALLKILLTKEGPYFVYKNADERYIKFSGRETVEIFDFIDIPLLKYTEPLEGIIFYLSLETLFEVNTEGLLMAIGEKANHEFYGHNRASIIHAYPEEVGKQQMLFEREFTKAEQRDDLEWKYLVLRMINSLDSLKSAIFSENTTEQNYALKALQVLGDIRSLKAVNNYLLGKHSTFRSEAIGQPPLVVPCVKLV